MTVPTRFRLFCTTGVLALLLTNLSACRTLTETQFQIRNVEMSDANRELVIGLVQDVAINAGMVDATARSKAADTLAYFEEPVKTFRTTLGVRSTKGTFVIDLACFDARHCESTTFDVTKTLLEKSLQREFGDRWQLVSDSAQQVPVERQASANQQSQ